MQSNSTDPGYTLGKIQVDGWPEQHHRGWVNVRVTLADGRFATAGGWWKLPGAENPWEDPDGNLRNSRPEGGYYGDGVTDISPYDPSEWGDSSPGLSDDEDACEVIAKASCSKPVRQAVEAYGAKQWPQSLED